MGHLALLAVHTGVGATIKHVVPNLLRRPQLDLGVSSLQVVCLHNVLAGSRAQHAHRALGVGLRGAT